MCSNYRSCNRWKTLERFRREIKQAGRAPPSHLQVHPRTQASARVHSCASSNTRATAPLRLKVPPPLPRAGTSLSSVQWRMCVKPSSSLGRERLALMRRTMPCTLDGVTFGSGDKATVWPGPGEKGTGQGYGLRASVSARHAYHLAGWHVRSDRFYP